jgi:hypothetical protein
MREHGEGDRESLNLNGVPPVFEGVHVALWRSGAGSSAAPRHYGPPFYLSADGGRINGWCGAVREPPLREGAASGAPTTMAGDHRGSPLREGAASPAGGQRPYGSMVECAADRDKGYMA